ncbi:MAG: helix-turn-helix domain-containing protein [Candidatus Omnitrophica bacterium]|nr:helix-turn-helix domain-containing protein [Candidatus Omnitrophota bacterium]
MDNYIERLKQIREEKKLSLREVARQLHMSEQCLLMIELGEIVPTGKQIEEIMEFVVNEI